MKACFRGENSYLYPDGKPKASHFAKSSHTKVCRFCGEVKPRIEFYSHPRNVDGRDNNRIVCKRGLSKLYANRRKWLL